MNGYQHGDEKKAQPTKELRSIDDVYLFNPSSGLYEPKSHGRQDAVDRKVTSTVHQHPLFTESKRDWVATLIAIAGLFISVLTLILLGLTVHYARRQWQVMNSTLSEIIKQTQASQTSSQQAITNTQNSILFFRDDERAWLELDPLKANGTLLSSSISVPHPEAKGVGGSATIRNYGKTIARHITVRETLQNGDESFGKIGSSRLRYIENTLAVGKNTAANKSEWIYVYSAPSPAALAPGATLASFIPLGGVYYPGQSTYVVGRISYSDSFGIDHWSTFCYRIDQSSNREYCESGNDEDQNPEYTPK